MNYKKFFAIFCVLACGLSPAMVYGVDCTVQPKGVAIPANTTIFLDASNLESLTELYLSVPTEAGNGNATSPNSSYVPKKDTWYPMSKVPGETNLWMAEITKASDYGRMSFWNKNLSSYDQIWEVKMAFQAPYNATVNKYKPDAFTSCRNEDRKADFSTQGTWTVYTSLILTASESMFDPEAPKNITLTAKATGLTGTNYEFQYCPATETTWKTLATQPGNTYVLSGANLPKSTTKYRVLYGGAESKAVTVVYVGCGEDYTKKNILTLNFDDDAVLTTVKDRKQPDNVPTGYTYQPWAGKINDGYCAVMADTYYGGCGEGAAMQEQVSDDCLAKNPWFRQLRDHTKNNQTTQGPYGGMLFINFKGGQDDVAYTRELTAQEKSLFVSGAQLSFTAWFACATKVDNPTSASMKLLIMRRVTPSGSWQTVPGGEIETKVNNSQGWVQGVSSVNIEDASGDWKIEIQNFAAGGTGNDVAIDDIRLDLCVPTFNAAFYELEEGKVETYSSYSFQRIDEEKRAKMLVPGADYGLGENMKVIWFYSDVEQMESKSVPNRFYWVGHDDAACGVSLLTTTDSSYTTLPAGSVLFDTMLQRERAGKACYVTAVIVAADAEVDDVVKDVEEGTIYPLSDLDYQFASNTISYTYACPTKPVFSFATTSTACAGEVVLPNVKINYGALLPNAVTDTIQWNNSDLINSTLNAVAAGVRADTTLDMSKASATVSKELLKEAGKKTLYLTTGEGYTLGRRDTVLCYSKTALELNVIDCSALQYAQTPEQVEICNGETFDLTFQVKNGSDKDSEVKVQLEAFPNGLAFSEVVSNDGGAYDNTTRLWNVGTVPARVGETPSTKTLVLRFAAENAKESGLIQSYISQMGTVTYASYQEAEAAGVAGSSEIHLKPGVEGIELNPTSEEIALGATTTTTLTVKVPATAKVDYTVTWTKNGEVLPTEPQQSTVQLTPCRDVTIGVTVKDACSNTYTAQNQVTVNWPTVFVPVPADGKNDDFLVGLEDPISITVFDRYGNKVYEGENGWPNDDAQHKMPGVYYYTVSQPMECQNQGRVEIYKAK